MDTLIPILVALVAFGFQAYANFQKEQDKARKRNPSQRQAANPERHGGRDVGRMRGKPSSRTPRGTMEYGDDVPATPPRVVPAPPVEDTPATSQAFEAYTGRVDEIRRQRRKRDRQTPEQVEITHTDDSTPERSASDFDLRDAVIKSAILERPYA